MPAVREHPIAKYQLVTPAKQENNYNKNYEKVKGI
jgi:hypothetical protein